MARKQPRKKKPAGYEMHVISNTHWDREWRQSFQHTRMMLVDVMDSLLTILDEHPEYACYHLDAQTILLEDYLAIRPEMRDALERHIAAERIWAGPWYTCADMNVISGESIVRNLLMGHKIARSFGGVMKVGYTPFSFGHIAQLPQIYAGFGIDTCFFYRGVGRDRAKAEFWWESPDGTRALTSQFSKRGRYNFYFHVYRPTVDGRSPNVVDMAWHEIGLPVRCADLENQYEAVYAMAHPTRFLVENIKPGIRALREEDKDEFTTPYFLLMQGCDTTAPNSDEPRIIAEADRCLEHDRVIHSSLPAYVAKLRKAVKDLPVLEGEMRVPAKEPGPSMVLQDTISARMYLKQANSRTQTALERWAEPMAVAAWQAGQPYPERFLECAWKYLLANQAHDSIAGCGVDEVHEDMIYRFEQARRIADEVGRRSLSELITLIDTGDVPEGGCLLTVWNSLPYPRSDVVTATIDFPTRQVPGSFALVDAHGNDVPMEVVSERPVTASVQLRADWPQVSYVRRYTVRFEANELPPLGYKAYTVVPRASSGGAESAPSSLVIAPRALANEHLLVRINDDGTLDVTHRESRKTYRGLHYFEDTGECGTPWERGIPEQDRVVSSLEFPPAITLESGGPLAATYRVEYPMRVPARGTEKRRSRETSALPITSWVTLKKGQPHVEILTRVDNRARDHLLRVLFPTHLDAVYSYADRPFDVIERPIALPDSSGWAEPDRGNRPQLSFIDLTDGTRGLAVFGDGLPEGAVSDDASRTIALTLLRTMAQVKEAYAFPPPKHEGTQCLGIHEYRYAVYPHTGDWEAAAVPVLAMQYGTPLRAMQSGRHEGPLTKDVGFLAIEPANLVFSGLKKAEDRNSIILRVFNPTMHAVTGTLSVHWTVKEAFEVSLEEGRGDSLPVKGAHRISIDVPRKKVYTLEIVPEQGRKTTERKRSGRKRP